MEWLNYHHLLYFWTVAREGTIARASEELRLAQPTISGQIRVLEDQLGEKLFQRSGRNLVLTDMGRVVYRYADDIFSLGRELMDTLKDRPDRPADALPGRRRRRSHQDHRVSPARAGNAPAATGADRLPRRRSPSACSPIWRRMRSTW
jgi:DNA-binding transcriptional LysR family regulator